MPLRSPWIAAFIVCGAVMSDAPAQERKPVDADMVARPPAPGTVMPAAFAFTRDGSGVTYLKSENQSLDRVLWQATFDGKLPRVLARPAGAGDVEGKLSREEALRRERQRVTATGISQVVRAADADVTIVPLSGELFLLKPDGTLDRLTVTEGPEIDPRPSPDGTKVAYVRGGELFVLDIATRKETQLSSGAAEGLTCGTAEFIAQEELDRFSGFWWSPDGETIAYQETDERHIPLYSIAHQGGEEFSVETHRYPFAGASNAKVRVGLVPAAGGETKWLASIGTIGDEAYLARVDWESPTALLVQILAREQKRLTLKRVDITADRATTVIEETSDTWIDLHDDLRVVPKTGEILWSSERCGKRQLELYDKDGKLLRVLTDERWTVDPLSFHSGIRGVIGLDADRREVWFQGWNETPVETHVARVSLDGGPVTQLTKGPGTHRAVVSPDGERFVVVSSSIQSPPKASVCDRDGKSLVVLADGKDDPRVAATDLTAPEFVTVPGPNGMPLYGAYYAPKSKALGPRAPVILMVYGGPTVQTVTNSWSLTADLTAQFLTTRGFAVWKMDNRGSSRRGRAFQAAVYRNLGTPEVDDQAHGIRALAALHPEVDPDRVGVTGGSYGGYMTIRCLELAGDVFKAGVSAAPVTSWDGYDTAYTERYMGTPKENSSGYESSSALKRAADLKGRLLIVHGMLDENVHFRHTARFATEMIRANRPFELLPLPDERHSSRRPEDRRYVAERTAEFFEKAFRPAPAPATPAR